MSALNGLPARLLVEAKHNAARRRSQVQRDDRVDFLDELRVRAVKPHLLPMRLNVGLIEDSMHATATHRGDAPQRQLFDEQVESPTAQALCVRQRVTCRRDNLEPRYRLNRVGPPAPRVVDQRLENIDVRPDARGPPTPSRHRVLTEGQLLRDLARGQSVRREQDDAPSPMLREAATVSTQVLVEPGPLGAGQLKRSSRTARQETRRVLPRASGPSYRRDFRDGLLVDGHRKSTHNSRARCTVCDHGGRTSQGNVIDQCGGARDPCGISAASKDGASIGSSGEHHPGLRRGRGQHGRR